MDVASTNSAENTTRSCDGVAAHEGGCRPLSISSAQTIQLSLGAKGKLRKVPHSPTHWKLPRGNAFAQSHGFVP